MPACWPTRARLDEWFAIEAVLPSVDHAVVLSPTAPTEEIVISAEQWRALAAIGGSGRVGLLLERLADDDLDALRLLKDLVEAGLLEVVDPQEWSDPEGAGSRHPPAPDDPEGAWHGRLPGVAPATSGTEPPVIVVRPTKPLRRPDPVLEARMDALASQLDVLYDGLQAAETEDVEASGGRTGLFGRLRRRHDR